MVFSFKYRKQRNTAIIITTLVVSLAFLTAGGLFFFNKNIKNLDGSGAVKDVDQSDGVFSFTGADGWRKGPSNATSMALFGSPNPSEPSPCFVSMEYKKGTVDVDAKQQDNHSTLAEGGYSVTQLGSETLTVQTRGGEKEYDLHQLNVGGSSSQNEIMGGNGLGYLQLSSGYLKVLANCNEAEQLSSTYSALEAIKVDEV